MNSEKLTQEFTSGQLVIGVCAALFLMCLCFLAGMVVGRLEPRDRVASNETATAPPLSPEESAAAATQRDRGTSQPLSSKASASGNRRASKKPTKPKDSATEKATAKPTESSRGTGPRTKELTPLPPAEDKTPVKAALQLTRDTTPAPAKKDTPPKSAVKPSTEDSATTRAAAKSETPPVKAQEAVVESSSALPSTQVKKDTPARATAPKTAPKTTPKRAATERTERGKYGIQVASLQGANRQTDAAAYLGRLKKGGYNAGIFPSEDGRYYRVLIVGYNDRTSAVAGCTSLRKKAAFYDAWVVKLP